MGRFASVESSHTASVSLADVDRAKNKGFWKWTAATLAIGLALPVFGILISTGMDFVRNGKAATRQKEVLASYYKNQVAATLGIDPNKVSSHELEMAARINPMIASAIAKVDEDKKSSNRAAVLGMGAAYATGAAFMPVAGAMVSGGVQEATKIGAHVTGFVVGGVASSLMDKNVLHVNDAMQILDEAQKKGQGIAPQQVLMLRIAQDESLQKAIHKHSSVPFHKMNEAQQQAVISTLPPQYWAEAQESATKVNSGQMQVQDLLMSGPSADGNNWRQRVANSRAASNAVAQQLG